jgi:hypothetical protein
LFPGVSAGDVKTPGFEPVAVVLTAVLFAQVSAAVGTVLHSHDLAIVAYRAPYESHFLIVAPSSRPLVVVTKSISDKIYSKR